LEAVARRSLTEAQHERRTAKALYAEIRAAGYDGGYTRLTDFIRSWRHGEGQGAAVHAFIPLAFELGEA
jgi:transposase